LRKNKILITGSSGKFGSKLIKNKFFANSYQPARELLDITKIVTIKNFFKKNEISKVIHVAAISNMNECELNPHKAIKTNVDGTLNLVNVVKTQKKNIKFIYISTDGVYPVNKGNNHEDGELGPYNVYCWTKFCAENIVKSLKNFVIIRTRFFDKDNLKFTAYADDIFTSSIEVSKLVSWIEILCKKNFKGIINIGDKKESSFNKIKIFNKYIKSCKYSDITKDLKYQIAKDASLNLSKMRKLINN